MTAADRPERTDPVGPFVTPDDADPVEVPEPAPYVGPFVAPDAPESAPDTTEPAPKEPPKGQ